MDDVLRPGRLAAGSTWRGLIVAPVVILLVLGAFAAWLSTAKLSPTERATLNSHDLLVYTGEHLALTFVSIVIVLALAIPLGILMTRRAFVRIRGAVLAVANAGQAAPVIGLVVLLAFWLGFTFWSAVAALVAYAALPVLRNTMVAIQGVDPRLVEAGRGMGMSAI